MGGGIAIRPGNALGARHELQPLLPGNWGRRFCPAERQGFLYFGWEFPPPRPRSGPFPTGKKWNVLGMGPREVNWKRRVPVNALLLLARGRFNGPINRFP